MIKALFDKYADESGAFDRIEDPMNRHPDVAALILLSRLWRGERGWGLIGRADEGVIWVCIGREELAEMATEADIIMLVRCGFHYDEDVDSLFMYV